MSEDRESWLNGLHRAGSRVVIGNGYSCAGCGIRLGIFTIEPFPPGYEPPEIIEPNWPFNEEHCPVHTQQLPEVDRLTARMLALLRAG